MKKRQTFLQRRINQVKRTGGRTLDTHQAFRLTSQWKRSTMMCRIRKEGRYDYEQRFTA